MINQTLKQNQPKKKYQYFKSQREIFMEQYLITRQKLLNSRTRAGLAAFYKNKQYSTISDLEMYYFEYLFLILQDECCHSNYSVDNLLNDFTNINDTFFDTKFTKDNKFHIDHLVSDLMNVNLKYEEDILLSAGMQTHDNLTIESLQIHSYLTQKHSNFIYWLLKKALKKRHKNYTNRFYHKKTPFSKEHQMKTYLYLKRCDNQYNNRLNRYRINNKAPWLNKQNKRKMTAINLISGLIYYLFWKPSMVIFFIISCFIAIPPKKIKK